MTDMNTNPMNSGTPPITPPASGGDGAAPALPDFIHDKFRGAENPLEAQARAYPELASMIGKRQEDIAAQIEPTIREKLQAELNAQLGVPEKLEGYTLPQDWNAEHPAAKSVLETFHKAGMGQKQLDAVFDAFRSFAPNPEAEMAKLGEEAQSRRDAAGRWLQSMLPDDLAAQARFLTASADGVRFAEALMQKMGSPMPNGEGGGAAPAGPPTRAKLAEMMRDPRWHDRLKRDPAYVKQVEEYATQLDLPKPPGM